MLQSGGVPVRFSVVETQTSSCDKDHLFELVVRPRNNYLVLALGEGRVFSRIQIDYALIDESSIARTEKVVELLDKIGEDLVDDTSLHLWGQLLVKAKLLDY